MEEKLFSSEQKLSRQEVAEHLEGIAKGIREGDLTLNYGNESIELSIGEQPEFEVEVEKEGDEYSLEVEVEWSEKDSGSFSIE